MHACKIWLTLPLYQSSPKNYNYFPFEKYHDTSQMAK